MIGELAHKNLTEKVIGIALRVHRNLGPGFPEKIYQRALYLEFKNEKVSFEREKKIQIFYLNSLLGYQVVDFIIDRTVVLEIKTVNEIGELYLAQMLSYLKAAKLQVGLILNFADKSLKIKRVIARSE